MELFKGILLGLIFGSGISIAICKQWYSDKIRETKDFYFELGYKKGCDWRTGRR